MWRVNMYTPCASHCTRRVRSFRIGRVERGVTFLTMFSVTALSVTSITPFLRANRTNYCSPYIAASNSRSFMLGSSCLSVNKPLKGTFPSQTAPQPRMLASLHIAAVGEGHTSRPTWGLLLFEAHHLRSRRAACESPGYLEADAEHPPRVTSCS